MDFLEQLAVFENLSPEQREAIAGICQEYEFDEGAVIAYQRDVADRAFIVKDGRLYSQTVDKGGVIRYARQHFPGDMIGEEWLFMTSTHPATITAATDGRMIVITGEDFIKFLVAHPDVVPNLEPDDEGKGLSEAGWEEAQKVEGRADPKSSAVDLLPDELVEYQARRSGWFLFLKIFWPFVGMIVVLSLVLFLLNKFGVPGGFTTVIFIIIFIIFAVVILFFSLDWWNDYFVITNKHLIHREFELRSFHITVNKIPVKQVQSVEILKPSLIATIFKIGSARVTTAAQKGVIIFDNISDPKRVEEALNRLTSRVKALNVGESQTIMRQSLESHFDLPPPYRPYVPPDAEDEEPPPPPPPAGPGWWERIKRRYSWRVEEGGIITYRRHIFVLLAGVWLPSLIGFFLMGVGFLLGTQTSLNDTVLLLIFGTLFLFVLGWFIWNFEDWRNDTFQVTNQYVVDIDRRPFGFGESRKQAPIAKIQNVNADRPGLLPTLFNYGFVYVDTAGSDTDITFEQVPKPSRIQADIFQKLALHEQAQRKRQGADRRAEYGVMLDVFRQAVEQNRIPQRTPPPGEFVEIAGDDE
jgi:uncharacterized membrane protein YdbT with pleckstrin-like domain